MKPRPLSIIFAGGGTGGHLNPGIAIAQEFMVRDAGCRILFVGTDRPLETALLTKAGFAHRSITAEGIMGRGIRRQIASLAKLPKGIMESIRILKTVGPDLVVGIGSYVSGPMVIGAWLLRLKISLHEQNIVPGISNRLLGFIADRVHVSFEETATYFGKRKVKVTGNPVRAEIIRRSRVSDGEDNRPGKLFTVLITGGSQGAHSINVAMVEALSYLVDKERFFFRHQTGAADEKMVAEAYGRQSIPCDVSAFFDDMARQFQLADLVICRAGATTVAEITTMGKAALFIPLPHTDNHQVLNAQALMKADGADMIFQDEMNGKVLMEKIQYLATHPEERKRMGRNAKALGRIHAARAIVDDCYCLMKGN